MPLQCRHKSTDHRQKTSCWQNLLNGRGCQPSLTAVCAASAASSALGQLGKPLEPGFDGGSGAHGSGGTGSGGSGGGGGEGGAGGSGPGAPEAEQHVGQVGGCAPAEDVVLLEVGGMHCASCSGRVRRLLEAQPHVTSASVSLTTETALVRIGIPALPLTGGPAGCLACPPHTMTATMVILNLVCDPGGCTNNYSWAVN